MTNYKCGLAWRIKSNAAFLIKLELRTWWTRSTSVSTTITTTITTHRRTKCMTIAANPSKNFESVKSIIQPAKTAPTHSFPLADAETSPQQLSSSPRPSRRVTLSIGGFLCRLVFFEFIPRKLSASAPLVQNPREQPGPTAFLLSISRSQNYLQIHKDANGS